MARYDFGEERRIYVHDLPESEVDRVVKDLVDQAKQINSHLW